MNPLRRIEPEVLALGREWTRLECWGCRPPWRANLNRPLAG